MKVLAVNLGPVRDTVIWTSVLEKLHEQLPQTELHILTYAANNAVLMNNPHVHKRHYLKTLSPFELLQKMWSLRPETYDWLLVFHASSLQARLVWLAGAENSAISRPNEMDDVISRHYSVLQMIGVDISLKLLPKIYVTKEEAALAEQKIQARIKECGRIANLPRFIFTPTFDQRYPKDWWLPLVKRVQDESSFQPLVMCDQELSQEWNLKEECRRLQVPLFDRESLREFITLMSRGQRCLANDSAPAHIAAALGLRTESIFE